MTRKIQYHFLQKLFRLLTFLADKSGGWAVFVKPKLVIGSLILGIGFSSCNEKPKLESKNKKQFIIKVDRSNLLKDQIKSIESIKIETTLCYFTVTESPKNELDVTPLDSTVKLVEQLEDDSIYIITQIPPQYPGGMDSLYNFIERNLQWPAACREMAIQGKVICSFVVEKDGSLSSIEVVRSLEPLLDKEAIRVIKIMPNWIPGKHYNQTVRVRFYIPIRFAIN